MTGLKARTAIRRAVQSAGCLSLATFSVACPDAERRDWVEDTTQFRIDLTEKELLTVKRVLTNCRIAAVCPNQPTMEIYSED